MESRDSLNTRDFLPTRGGAAKSPCGVSSGTVTTRIAILASGAGTNARALLDASSRGELGDARVVALLADKAGCGALAVADRAGVEGLFVDPGPHAGRGAYSDALVAALQERDVDLVCLSGFMRILSPGFIAAFERRILNIHPALLPAFPGAHAVRDALAWGVKVTGTTVHFADEAVDHGPIVAQESVPVLPGDDEETLHERIKAVEHRLYPEAVRLVVSGHARVSGRRVEVTSPVGAR
ncbi:MAG: phosphoribosylglycinamide formyltransferase 1 [Actinomycetota bacterium]|nr:phosphoribosylglycinamide formyltransferase 1 [Actinomycetota bacterium]